MIELNDYVEVVPIDSTGKVINIRMDSGMQAIYTIELDNCTDTPDGLYVARANELILL